MGQAAAACELQLELQRCREELAAERGAKAAAEREAARACQKILEAEREATMEMTCMINEEKWFHPCYYFINVKAQWPTYVFFVLFG